MSVVWFPSDRHVVWTKWVSTSVTFRWYLFCFLETANCFLWILFFFLSLTCVHVNMRCFLDCRKLMSLFHGFKFFDKIHVNLVIPKKSKNLYRYISFDTNLCRLNSLGDTVQFGYLPIGTLQKKLKTRLIYIFSFLL